VGKENTTGFTASQLADRFGLYDFVGKSVAFCGEVELRGNSRNGEILETLKSITGEDMLRTEQKYNPEQMSSVLPTRLALKQAKSRSPLRVCRENV
jgi:phage/plasmid-associated DNA primase